MDIKSLIKSDMIRILFQPIHDYRHGYVIGYEALARGPEGSLAEGAKNLFKAAKQSGLRMELEMHCFRKALNEYRSKIAGDGGLLFVNFHPEILAGNCDEIISELSGIRERTVIEVTESYSRIRCISGHLQRLKGKGVRVALDDIGAGDRSLSNLCETRVDYLKIDRQIIQGLTKVKSVDSEYYKLLLKFLTRFAKQAGALIIAEGIETFNQVSETLNSGVSLMQGFYFSRPKPADFWINNRLAVKER